MHTASNLPPVVLRLSSLDEGRSLPIDFSPPLVRAILAGRKSCTRRLIASARHEPWAGAVDAQGRALLVRRDALFSLIPEPVLCRYGEPGTLLYMREALEEYRGLTLYAATREVVLHEGRPMPWRWQVRKLAARYCPKLAARVVLRNTGVRVERLQDIDEAEAAAEGLARDSAGYWLPNSRVLAVDAFRFLWNSLHESSGTCWDDNPGVYRVGLEEVQRRSAGEQFPR